MNANNVIQSFMMGGFECCDMLNRYGQRVDLLKETTHIEFLKEDYLNLKEYNITSVREGIRWSAVEKYPYQYDWDDFHKIMRTGKKYGIQQIWDICHFGMPADLTPLHPQFLHRFVSLCIDFVMEYRKFIPEGNLIVTPINEVSFFSWLGGEVGATTPYTKRCGWEVKYALTKAYIAGIKAMKEIDDEIIILTTEPLVDIIPPLVCDSIICENARQEHEEQYQVTDIICGRICQELGGAEDLIDVIGYNFYFSNRFSTEPGDVLSWINEHNDIRFRPLNELLEEGYARYNRPIILAKTSFRENIELSGLRILLKKQI